MASFDDIKAGARPIRARCGRRAETTPTRRRTAKARVPGTAATVEIQGGAAARGDGRTMRLGIQEKRARAKGGGLLMPSLHRALYRPGIFYGTSALGQVREPCRGLTALQTSTSPAVA